MRRAGFRYVFLGIENVLDEDLAFLRASAKNARAAGRPPGRQRVAARHSSGCTTPASTSSAASSSAIPAIRASRSKPTCVCAALRRLALHPASDAVSGHADDQGLSRARADRQRAGRGIRRHDRRREQRASDGRRDRVHALARGAMDEAAAPAESGAATIPGSCCGTGRGCSRTRSAAARGGRRSGSRISAPCSRATRRFGGASASSCPPARHQPSPHRARSPDTREMAHETAVDLLVFGPHPDDIEIGLGGTVARHAAAGHRVGLCDLTRGELSSNGTPEERRARRKRRRSVLGAAWRDNLSWPDGGISGSAEQIVSAVELIRRSRPRTVAIPYWDDRHPDHVAASHVLRQARLQERPPPIPCPERGVASRLGLLLLHQRQRGAVICRRCLRALRAEARGAGVLPQPVRGAGRGCRRDSAHASDVPAAHRKP